MSRVAPLPAEIKAIDAASADDAAFFEQHPEQQYRLREAYPGEEFGPLVEVSQPAPGVRARRTYDPGPVNEALGVALNLLSHLPAFDPTKSRASIENVIAEMVRVLPRFVLDHAKIVRH